MARPHFVGDIYEQEETSSKKRFEQGKKKV
jgi:hypothetical protein